MEPPAPPDALAGDLPAPPRQRRLLGFVAGSLGVLALLATLAGALLFALVEQRSDDLHAALGARLESSANGTARFLATWLDGTARLGQRLTRSDLVRLFATEMATSRPARPPDRWLADQIPYMTQLISDFVAQHGLLGATLLSRDGRILLASRDAPLPARRSWAERVARLDHPSVRIVTPIRALAPRDAAPAGGASLALDLLLPVPSAPAQDDGEAAGFPAVLVMTAAVDGPIAEALAASGPGSLVRLIQPGADGPEQVVLAPDPAIAPLDRDLPLSPGDAMAYGSILTPSGDAALAAGVPVPGLPWTVLQQIDAGKALAPLQTYRQVAAAVAAAAALALGMAFSAFWWRQRRIRESELARQWQALGDHLQEQRQTSWVILDAIPDMIGIKAQDGRYRHVNRAFARSLGRPPERIIGRIDSDLFPAAMAGELGRAGAQACQGAPVPPLCVDTELAGQRRRLSISIKTLEGTSGEVAGLLLVARDDDSGQGAAPQQAGRQAAAALVRAVGLRDPFLLEQTGRLRSYARAVGERLDVSETERATLDLAASLSQVGKIFVPDWLLAKTGRETPDETRMMRAHLHHALEVIGAIDFGLPVAEVISQMHERLDGSGYPRGLRGEQIGLPARVLGTIEAFCARTAPRVERDHDTPGQALYAMAQNAQRYDVKVISALAAVIAAEGHDARSGGAAVAEAGRSGRQVLAEAAA